MKLCGAEQHEIYAILWNSQELEVLFRGAAGTSTCLCEHCSVYERMKKQLGQMHVQKTLWKGY